MANLLANGDFEAGDDGNWTGDAEIQTSTVMEGSYALSLVYDILARDGEASQSEALEPVASEAQTIKLWVRCDNRVAGYQLRVSHFPWTIAGGAIEVAKIEADELSEGWNYVEYEVTPNYTEDAIKLEAIKSGISGSTFSNIDWYVDNVSYDDGIEDEDDDVAFTLTLRNGIEADLKAYDSWTKTPAYISAKLPKDWSEVHAPAVFIAPGGGGQAVLETMTNQRGSSTQQFVLVAVVDSDTPISDMDDFTDEIRNAVERSDASVVNLATVWKVDVIAWDDVIPDEVDDPVPTRLIRQIVVSIEYVHARGSL